MPQLKLIWWLFNFFLSWLFLILVTSIIMKNKMNKKTKMNFAFKSTKNKNKWLWN